MPIEEAASAVLTGIVQSLHCTGRGQVQDRAGTARLPPQDDLALARLIHAGRVARANDGCRLVSPAFLFACEARGLLLGLGLQCSARSLR